MTIVALRLAFFAIAVWFLLYPATAHDLDCKGKPVDPATKHDCCGLADAMVLGFDQVGGQDERGAWHVIIDGADHAVVDVRNAPIALLPAKDGCYRVWYRRQHLSMPPFPEEDPHGGGGSQYHFYCFQGPLTG